MPDLHCTIALPWTVLVVALLACSVDSGTWPEPPGTVYGSFTPYPTYTPNPTYTPTYAVCCTPPACRENEAYFCPKGCTCGCGTICVTRTVTPLWMGTETPSTTPTPTQTRSTTPTPIVFSCADCADEAWTTYSSSEYGFSISFPAYLEVVLGANTPTLYIGDQVHVWISDSDPLQCRGDCLVVESTNPARVAGLEATRVAGYMGAIGGTIPQRYLRYILKHDDRFYVFTLFALGSHATSNDFYTIWPLEQDDVTLFEQILETVELTN